ncbi:cytochrome c peroxidase [Paludisphaera sp.]|uniref:cytochrome-c peroxidase n=1 Tax=Paludisphaera sp. TaxID=2017432 RepID=UPI00301DE4E0
MTLKKTRWLLTSGLLSIAGLALLQQSMKANAQDPAPPEVVDEIKNRRVEKAESDPAAPEDFLWQKADTSLIQDEPLVVKAPRGLPPLAANSVVPASNPLTKGGYELGRLLFFDPRISLDESVSCATCHNPDKGWSDGTRVSTGIDGLRGTRNSPTVFNAAYAKSMFWDGRAASVELQAQGPMVNPVEMGDQTYEEIVHRIREIPAYREMFRKTFGTDVTLDGMSKAIATFERVAALTGNSKYDQYVTGDLEALNESEKRGMVLFGLRLSPQDEYEPEVELQKAKCTLCHVGANFTDEQYHNLGVGWDEKKGEHADIGRWVAEAIGHKSDHSFGAFRTPTCRNVALTAPYMHDGSMKTLEEVMEHYNKGGTPNPSLDKDMKPLNLTEQEIADVIAFMHALTGEYKPTSELIPEKLPPNADGDSPDPVAALTPPGS